MHAYACAVAQDASSSLKEIYLIKICSIIKQTVRNYLSNYYVMTSFHHMCDLCMAFFSLANVFSTRALYYPSYTIPFSSSVALKFHRFKSNLSFFFFFVIQCVKLWSFWCQQVLWDKELLRGWEFDGKTGATNGISKEE